MELAKLSIKETAEGFRKKEFTPSELTAACLGEIEKKNPKLNAYLEVFSEDAHAQAKEADERFAADSPKSPIDGIPVAIKDNMLVLGKRCTAGSKILEPYIASYDATVVVWLKKAGAIILGKTNLDEFAMGSSTEHSAFGPTRNPVDTDRVPGGSSGGSAAAVAAHFCTAAFGSDTGGSIRQPAAFCGVVGLKPTYGRVSRSGLIAMASSLDQIGPFTKTIEDSSLLFSTIAGHDSLDPTTHPDAVFSHEWLQEGISGMRIGIPKEYFGEGLDPQIRSIIEGLIAKLGSEGAEVVDISLPHAPLGLAVYYLIMPSEVSANLARFDGIRYGSSVLRNSKSETRNQKQNLWDVYFDTRREYFGEEARRRIMLGTFALSSGYYDAYYARAQKVRAHIKNDFDIAFQSVDAVLTPTSPVLPFRFGERAHDPLAMYLADIYTVSVNLAGVPAISIPAGYVNHLPVGVQLIAKPFNEAVLFQAGRAIEQVR